MVIDKSLVYVLIVILFFLGTALGSFLNVILLCVENGKKFLRKKRSRCAKCKKALKWYDLLPLISFILLKRKCRNCHKKIAWRYFFIELASGVITVMVGGIFLRKVLRDGGEFGFIDLGYLVMVLTFTQLLLFTFVYDLKKTLIDNRVVAYGIFLSVVNLFYFQNVDGYSDRLLWTQSSFTLTPGFGSKLITVLVLTFIVTFLFWSLHYYSKGKWLGGGDVKLVFWLGLMFGWPLMWIIMLLGFTSGSLIGLYLISTNKKKMKSKLPLGPFLTAAAFVIMIYGDRIYEYYMYLVGIR